VSENISLPSGADGLLLNLNEEQRHAVTIESTPLAIHAGAGSGKTRVLTHRIAWRSATGLDDSRRVLALTFTRTAAAELNYRLRNLGLRDQVATGTFHAVAYAQLRNFWREKSLPEPELLTKKYAFITSLLPRDYRSKGDVVVDVVREIEWAKARRIHPQAYAGMAENTGRKAIKDLGGLGAIGDIYQQYEDLKSKQNKIDFDDMLVACAKAIRSDRSFGNAQRWRFRHLYVDEFQDVNSLQVDLLDAWLHGNENLCVVGDPNQAIYAWNGAEADHLIRFDTHFTGGVIVGLGQNYRSTPQILRTAASVIDVEDFKANKPSGLAPSITPYHSDEEEMTKVAQKVRDSRGPYGKWADQAILARTTTQVEKLSRALRDAGIPVRTLAGSSLFDRSDVKRRLDHFKQNKQPLEDLLGDLHVGSDETAETDSNVQPEERQTAFSDIRKLAKEYLTLDPSGTGGGFFSWIRTHERTSIDTSIDAVEVATFHSSKGREWPTVHIVGLEKGLVPIANAGTEVDEEKRLLYVALTRAKENLFLSWAKERSFGDNNPIKREPSDLLEPIDEAIQNLDQPLNKTQQIDEIKKARKETTGKAEERKNSEVPPELPVMESLRSWRRKQAEFSKTKEEDILKDSVFDSLVQKWPSTRDELLEVHGINDFNIERIGKELLSILNQFSELKPKTSTQKAIENKAEPKNEDQKLTESLRTWRTEMAAAAGTAAWRIFKDETLTDLVKKRPRNIDELLAVHGIGPSKAKEFGQDLLEFFKE